MSAPRLTAGLRVAALLRRADLAGRAAYVVSRGDDTAGALLVSVQRPDGTAESWGHEYDLAADRPAWVQQARGEPRAVDAAVARQRAADPDLWVIELELPEGVSPAELLD